LRTFGIPTDSLPTILEEGAKDALRKLDKWCLMRQTKEGLMEKIGISNLTIVECPFPEDCLFGKG
jgi:oligoribonuclease (3'-5' exoribonuclease)